MAAKRGGAMGDGMKRFRQYLQLLAHVGGTRRTETTLRELAGIWGCTVRNAALIIAHMEERGWINWQARRGRNNRSVLTLLAAEEEIAAGIIDRTESSRDLLGALEQLSLLEPSGKVRARLEAELFSRFGFRRETSGRRKIDVLRLPIRQAPRTLDPMEMNLLTESFIAGHIYDPLVRMEKGRPVPHLAHAWEANREANLWTFRLRKGVCFHHGRELDSGDAAFSLSRLSAAPPGTLYRHLFRKIRRVAVRDERTFTVELESPLAFLPELLATGRAAVLPADLGRTDPARFRRRPAGTGPFKLTAFDSRMLGLEAFEGYFRERAHLDKVEIWVLQEHEEEEMFGEEVGNLFRIIHNPREPVGMEPGWRQIGSGVMVSKFLTVNTRKPGLLSDSATRAAVMDLIAATSDVSETGRAAPASSADLPSGALSSAMFSANNRNGIPARGALPEAGASLRLVTIQPYGKDALAVARRLGQYGIAVEVELVPTEAFSAEKRLSADLLFFTLIRDREEMLRQYDLFLTMADHLNERDASGIRVALSTIDRETDRSKRLRLMADLERRLVRDRLLVIWQERSARMAVHESVGGAAADDQGWVDLRTVWFR